MSDEVTEAALLKESPKSAENEIPRKEHGPNLIPLPQEPDDFDKIGMGMVDGVIL